MRQNKLSKFCDLLTNQLAQDSDQVRAVIRQLNSVPRFTLFVPTNEALLLQPPGHLFEQLRARPEEVARFLLSHATSELVVPKQQPATLNALSGPATSASVSDQLGVDRTPGKRIQYHHQQSSGPVRVSNSIVFSLAQTPLRVSSLSYPDAILSPASAPMSGSRLELIVDGANVIPGQSYALQEPNNSNATHAIVHLIDRSLYPAASETLLQMLKRFAPTMASLIDLGAQSSPSMADFRRLVLDRLESGDQLSTLFAPNEEAFKATPAKLLDQLHTNRTFLQQFLKAHLVDGLHYNGQLASLSTTNNINDLRRPAGQQRPATLDSIGGEKLEFEAKSLQNRQLVVVNSVPIVFSDLMATNGVLHLLNRPLLPANLLDDCKCAQALNSDTSRNLNVASNQFGDTGIIMSRGQAVGSTTTSRLKPSDSLEREASNDSHQLLRAQRSNGNLPIGPDRNRDFYRPSLAPANLKLVQPADNMEWSATIGGTVGPVHSSPLDERARNVAAVAQIIAHQPQHGSSASEPALAVSSNGSAQQPAKIQHQPLTLEPKYEVTLNATSRLRLRAEQVRAPNGPAGSQFEYDQPLAAKPISQADYANHSQSNLGERLKRPYLAGVIELVPVEDSARITEDQKSTLFRHQLNKASNVNPERQLDFLSRGESAKREQRLLKFQPEDGRDSIGKTSLQPMAPNYPSLANPLGDVLNNFTRKPEHQPAGEIQSAQRIAIAHNSNVAPVFSSASKTAQLQATSYYDYTPTVSSTPPSSKLSQATTGHHLDQLPPSSQKLRHVPTSLSCAFYDADCRRLMGRLVRLPPVGSRLQSATVSNVKNMPTQNVTAAYDTRFGEPTSLTPINHQHHALHHGDTNNRNHNNNNYTSISMNINKSLIAMSGLKQATLPSTNTTNVQQPTKQDHNNTPAARLISGQPRLSVLNQPLPPLGIDEAGLKHLASGHHWRAHDAEINRIPAAQRQGGMKQLQQEQVPVSASGRLLDSSSHETGHGFTSGISRAHSNSTTMTIDLPRASPNAPLRQAQILFVPVKLVNHTNIGTDPNHHRFMNLNASSNSLAMNLPDNVLVLTPNHNNDNINRSSTFSTPQPPYESATTQSTLPAVLAINSRYQQYSPLLGSSSSNGPAVSVAENYNHQYNNNHHNHRQSSSRSNLTLADDTSEFGFDSPMGADLNNQTTSSTQPMALEKQMSSSRQSLIGGQSSPTSSLPQTPANLIHNNRKQHGLVHFGGLSASEGAPAASASGVKWPNMQQQQMLADFSVTSARLTDNNAIQLMLSQRQQQQQLLHNNNYSSGLATQASDQLALHHRHTTVAPPQTSADYFQDRTIAEIMDDSGLRIDGQLVTFKRLKQCLGEANLLSLALQTGSSLTMFMPTDQAFQRLVQVAFGQRQQQQQNPSSARFLATGQQQQQQAPLPLVVRAPPMSINDNAISNQASSSGAHNTIMSSLGAIDRLTLDCQAPIVRQMLLDHISARLVTPKQLAQDTNISSLSGKQLILSSVPSKQIVVVDGQPVLAATRAKNGMVYVINKFLNITNQMANVVDLMQTQPELSTFVSYMRQNNELMFDRLKRETGPLTVLAPTNEAFEQLSPSARQLINSDPSALMDILRGHVLEGAQFGKLISMRSQLNTMNRDQKIEARVIKPNVYMLDNQMTSMRLVGTAANGLVNAIDRLIVPAWLRVSMSTSQSARPPTAGLLDTSASANSGAATLARQVARLHEQSRPISTDNNNKDASPNSASLSPLPSPQVQPELAHGSADSIFRPSSKLQQRHKQLHQHQLFDNPLGGSSSAQGPSDQPSKQLLPSSNSLNNLGRLNGENFLRFGANNKHLNGSSSASSILGADGSFSGLSNELGSTGSTGSTRSTNDSQNTTSLTSKNMLLIEKMANLMHAKKFLKFLLNSRAHELLKPDMNYVILVPTDQAIERLPGQILSLLDRDLERLSDLVNYHIIDTTFEYINTIPDGQTLQTLNEKDILFNWHRNNTILTVSGAIVLGGIQEENIALLIVDRVLYPTPGDLLAIVNKSPILSNFTTIIRNAGLENQLSRAGPYTLFAPSDAAFNQLDRSDLDFLQRNKEIARRFLLRHLSSPMLFTSSIALSSNMTNSRLQQLVPSINVTNSLGEDLILRQRNDYFSVNDINFSYADVAASNGVLHVIDGLL